MFQKQPFPTIESKRYRAGPWAHPFLIGWLFIAFLRTPFAGVVINELMVNPLNGGEWVELYNPTDQAIDLDGYLLCDAGDAISSPLADLQLPAGAYLVLAQDSAELLELWPFLSSVRMVDPSGWVSLNNENDRIHLKDQNGHTVDSVPYNAKAWFGSAFPKGVSMERRDPLESAVKADNWMLSTNRNGCTPGFVNSAGPVARSTFRVQVGPRAFSPARGEAMGIRIDLPERGELRVEIFDATGISLAQVFSGEANGEKTFFWDGKLGTGGTARPGPKILYVAYDGPNGKEVFKQAIVVVPD